MYTIRRSQIEAMSELLAHRWEERMVIHLETFFPEACAERGPAGVRAAIDLGVKKAARYNIFSERDVCKFLNFMFVYGFDFDVDPSLPWAAEILNDPALERSVAKLYMLEKAANGELEPPPEPTVEPSQAEMDAALREAEKRDRELIATLPALRDPPKTGDGDGTTS
jgi:hypothetical protein